MSLDNDGIVEPTATENTGVEVAEQTEVDAQDPEQQEAEQEQEQEQEEKPKKNRAQERIEHLARENAELKRWRAEQEAKAQQPEKPSERPNIADYDDINDYYKAVDEYQIEQSVKRMKAETEQQRQDQQATEQTAKFQSAIVELADEGIDYQIYAQKAEELPPLPVTLDQFGLSPKDTLLLAKTLIDDTDTYYELSQMSQIQAAVKIGQIIAKTSTKPVATSKAPPPLKPTKANAPATRSPESMSDDEWYKAETQKRKGK